MWGRGGEGKTGIAAGILRRAVAAAPAAFAVTARNGRDDRIVYLNRTLEELTGYAAEELLGKSGSLLLGKKSWREAPPAIREARRSGGSLTTFLRCRRKDGTSFDGEIALAPLPDRSGAATHFVWLLRNVSEQARKEKDLLKFVAEKESRFAAYMGHANEAVWRLDFEPPVPLDQPEEEQVRLILECGVYSEANDAVAKVYGFERGRDVVGRPLREFMPPSDPKTMEALAKFVRHRFRMDNLITHETTANGMTTVAVNNIEPGIEKGRVRHVWGASLDLTEFFEARKDLDASLKELDVRRKALEQKNAALRELLSLVEQEKKEVKERVAANIEAILIPCLEKIEAGNRKDVHLRQLRSALEDLTSSFGQKLSASRKKLTPREIEVCNLVKDGLDSKEIAQILNVAVHTVEKHRRMARNKLGLANTGTNLRTYLSSL
jgi:PAS domain S-box-containing protein